MIRNRNSFFQEANMSAYGYVPNNMPNMIPYQTSSSSQSYFGPTINQVPNNNFDDYENRLAKLERQINRLDARITKLENASKLESVNISDNMYMV